MALVQLYQGLNQVGLVQCRLYFIFVNDELVVVGRSWSGNELLARNFDVLEIVVDPVCIQKLADITVKRARICGKGFRRGQGDGCRIR